MKSYFLSLIVLLLPLFSMAQANSLTVYTEGREKFTLTLDGKQQNAVPKDEIRIEQLKKSHVDVQVVFKDNSIAPITDNLRVVDPDGNPADVTYKIITNGESKYIFKLLSCVPATGGYTSHEENDDEATGHYYDPTAPIAVKQNTVNSQQNSSGSVTGMPGASQPMQNMSNVEQSGVNTMNNTIANRNISQNADLQTTTVKYSLDDGRTRANTGGCDHAMDDASFKDAKESVMSKDDEISKVIVAKSIVDDNCLTAQQVYDMCKVFSFEKSRLDFAKYAYVRTVDPANYSVVNNCFEFDKSKQELAAYMKSHQ